MQTDTPLPADLTVVYFSLFRTDNPYSSISLSMSRELALHNQVIYVNHPYSLKDVWTGWRKGDAHLRRRLWRLLTFRNGYESVDTIPKNFVAVQPPVTLPINWLPKGPPYRFFQRLNDAVVLRAIRSALRRQGVDRFIFINCYDPFFIGILPKKMGALCQIYQCIDDITQNNYTNRHGTELENQAIAQADLTLVTSTNLHRLKSPFSDRIHLFVNAADTDIFKRALTERFERPAELSGRVGSVIGFVGNLDELRIDYPLLLRVAQAHPDKTLLLVGPINSPEPAQIGLDRQPNVIFAGSRPIHQLPPYLQYMDAVLIPFLCNTLTRSIYPLKINEYLAAGKPVVSTAFSADIRSFEQVIYLAGDHDEFCALVGRALTEDNAGQIAARSAVASENTWTARVRQLGQIVEPFVKKSAK